MHHQKETKLNLP